MMKLRSTIKCLLLLKVILGTSGLPEDIKLSLSYTDVLLMKCDIQSDSCCKDVKEVEFLKNGAGVFTIESCEDGYVMPMKRNDTRFYYSGCVGGNIRKSFLHITRSRLTDIGNWTCKCFDKDRRKNCKSNDLVLTKKMLKKGLHEDIKLSISYTDALLMNCDIQADICCQDVKEVEFFKNGTNVCTIASCNDGYVMPPKRDDTLYYYCGCSDINIRKSFLHITQPRLTDIGSWTCKCFDKHRGKNCKSNDFVITQEFLKRASPVPSHYQDECSSKWYWYLPAVFAGIIVSFIIWTVCIYILKRRSNGLTVGTSSCLSKILCLKVREIGNKEIQLLGDQLQE